MLGLQPAPTAIEALAYVLYAVPMLLYVLWPDRLRAAPAQPRIQPARRRRPRPPA